MKTNLYRLLPFRQLILLSFLLLFSAVKSYSQTLEWEKIIGHYTNDIDKSNASVKLSDSRYVFGGYNSPRVVNNRLMQVPWLVFVNPVNADTLFTRSYPQFETGSIVALCVNSDSSLMVICESYDMNTSTRQNLMFRTDYQGNIIWQKYYPNIHISKESKIITVPDGYLFITSTAFQITKLDKLGNVVWRRYETDTAGFAEGNGRDITLLKDGSYLACGGIPDSNSTNPTGFFQTSPYLVQLRPNGDTIRTKILGSVYDHDLVNTARQTSDGGLILAGRYVQNTNGTRMQGMVIKLDSAWNQEWQQFFYPKTGAYNDGCELFNVQETMDGSFIVSGYYRDDVPPPWGDAAGFVAKLSKTGGVVWQRQYQVNGIGEWFTDMVYNDNGSAIFSGNKRITSNDEDFYLVKLSGLGLPYKPDYCSTLPVAGFTASLLAGDTVAFAD
ncbi:MAG: hypothetical protein LPK19_05575, partial [Hymenobacteraceae bacterium]|nr:hypothetical protein [Hymenobacteraceae bacterium]MDX5395671.1 hypothetical protein [Hymenobacteraceae bacterium]MDX5511724.1 hypothetical protein [Hymenobacteraceae bacterium]